MIKGKTFNTIAPCSAKQITEYEFKTIPELREEIKAETDEKKKTQLEKQLEERLKIADIGKSVTDDSHFIPIAELVKRNGQSAALMQGNDEIKGRYDFADGKDNGMRIPKSRNVRNLAELDKDIRDRKKEIKKEIKNLSDSISDAKEMM